MPLIRIPLNPVAVPEPPEAVVIEPMLLLEMLLFAKLKSKMPMVGAVPAVVEVSFTTIVEDPSKLPIVLPVTVPTLNKPPVVPIEIAVNAALELEVDALLDVWLIPEIILP